MFIFFLPAASFPIRSIILSLSQLGFAITLPHLAAIDEKAL